MPPTDRELLSAFFLRFLLSSGREFLDRFRLNNHLQLLGRRGALRWEIDCRGKKQGPWEAIAFSMSVSFCRHNNCSDFCFVKVGDVEYGRATGPSKVEAQEEAARLALIECRRVM